MADLNIRTTLNTCPDRPKKEITIITRGASAELTFNLTNKVYTLDNVEQFLFTFKQGRKVYQYKMFDYVKHTLDEEIDYEKTYYRNVSPPINGDPMVYMLTGIKVKDPDEELPIGKTPTSADWYEITEMPNGCDMSEGYYWIMDDHFWYNQVSQYSWISFVFSASETASLFKSSKAAGNIQWEAAIRLDTDKDEFHTHGKDSLIIEHLPQLAVMDSLLSGQSIKGNGSDSGWNYTASTVIDCTEDLKCRY